MQLETLAGDPVDGLYFRSQRDLTAARDTLRARGVTLYESDLKPADRYLMERFVHAGFEVHGEPRCAPGYLELRNPAIKPAECRPRLTRISLDVESDGLSGQLYSIAVHGEDSAIVFMISDTALRI